MHPANAKPSLTQSMSLTETNAPNACDKVRPVMGRA